MSDTNTPAPQFGRPMRRKLKYGAPASASAAAAGRPAVGPVDDPALLANAALIVKSPTPPPPPFVPTSRERKNAEPDEQDFKLRDLSVYMAKGLVDHPDAVDVEILSAGSDGVFELSVHPDDIGHVIGKQGRTARSLRLTLGAAAARIDRRVDLEIAD